MSTADLLNLETADFRLSIWCRSIHERADTLRVTQNRHAAGTPSTPAPLRFDPPVHVHALAIDGQTDEHAVGRHDTLPMPWPLFFENLTYIFEWEFTLHVTNARLEHRLQAVNDSFRFVPARHGAPARLQGTLNTGNDLGWLRLPVHYELPGGHECRQSMSFEVLPVKMLLHRDLPVMYRQIDRELPLWRFKLAGRTQQDAGRRAPNDDFMLFWLANFDRLRTDLERGLKIMAHAPHTRLQPHVRHLQAARVRARLHERQAQMIRNSLNEGRHNQRFRVQQKQLDLDTPENRFVRHIVEYSKTRLFRFEQQVRRANAQPEYQQLSNSFFEQLHTWQQPLERALRQSFLKNVRAAMGEDPGSSLVLQQKAGYSQVYRVWQQLKTYLDVFDRHASLSMRTIAEIYEVWCFLTLDHILQEHLAFRRTGSNTATLVLNMYSEYGFEGGFAGAISYERDDGVQARLAHEPVFSRHGKTIRTYWTRQKPDILLEVRFPDAQQRQYIWLFDAKYRIGNRAAASTQNDSDLAPDDAINQMHRYRDALVRITQHAPLKDGPTYAMTKSRPVVGAFVLYPGFHDQQQTDNPYTEVIEEIGIGAFALLPDCELRRNTQWLSQFMSEQIGTLQEHGTSGRANERLAVENSVRIAADGMYQVHYPDLLFIAALAPANSRSNAYFQAFEQGRASHYHMPVSTFVLRHAVHIASEIRYLGLTGPFVRGGPPARIEHIWPVLERTIIRRRDIPYELSGRHPEPDNADQNYLLFTLGAPLRLRQALVNIRQDSFRSVMKLTRLQALQMTQDYAALPEAYRGLGTL